MDECYLTTKHHDNGVVEFVVRKLTSANDRIGSIAKVSWKISLGLIALRLLIPYDLQWLVLCCAIGAFMYATAFYVDSQVSEEAVIVLEGLGLQTRTRWHSGKEEAHMIENCDIKDVVINEGIKPTKIIFYLAVLLQNQNAELVLLFENLLPRLHILKLVRTGIREMLFSEKGEGEENESTGSDKDED